VIGRDSAKREDSRLGDAARLWRQLPPLVCIVGLSTSTVWLSQSNSLSFFSKLPYLVCYCFLTIPAYKHYNPVLILHQSSSDSMLPNRPFKFTAPLPDPGPVCPLYSPVAVRNGLADRWVSSWPPWSGIPHVVNQYSSSSNYLGEHRSEKNDQSATV
jgi:hypothetical protein